MNKALMIIDVQKGMFTTNPPIYKGETLLKNIKRAMEYAKEKEIPIIFVHHNGPEGSPLEKGTAGWNIHERISPEEGSIIIEKKTPDSFYQTDLQKRLSDLNIDHLIITGIQTEACVDTICRRSCSLDYKVTLLTDAHSTFDKTEISAAQIISHHNEVLRWFAETVNTEEWLLQ